jgi:GT2 family glycosyltransferase
MQRSLSIIIPNYNGEELLKTFMPSVLHAAKNYKGVWEIVLVDDLSSDNSYPVLEELKSSNPQIKIVYNKVNLGFAGTCNAGIKAAKGEVLFFLNNDVRLNEDYFDHFNEYFNDSSTFAVTTKAYRLSDSSFLDGQKPGSWNRGMPKVYKNIDTDLSGTAKKPFLSFAVQGAYFFADAKKVNHLEGFDELLSPYIFEETDLSYRALKRGWKIFYEPACISYHAVSATIKKKKKKKTQIIATKNKLLFVWKNIHSTKLMVEHLLFLLLRLLTFNVTYASALKMALKNLSEIRKKREIEKKAACVDDLDLFRSYDF